MEKYFEINTPSEEEAYIKAWEFFKNNYVKELKTKKRKQKAAVAA